MAEFTPCEKLSKKTQRELDQQRRTNSQLHLTMPALNGIIPLDELIFVEENHD